MASFQGHALPGTFFLLFGLWWTVKCVLKHYSRKLNKNNHLHRSFDKLEFIEGILKVASGIIGILAEQFVSDGPHLYLYTREPWSWVHLMNWQHCTMYLFFGLSGAVDVLTYCPVRLPLGFDRLMLAIAFFVEGFLFYFHVHKRPMLDQLTHSLLLPAIFGGCATTVLEIFLQDNFILELFRASLAILQGTWFWQIGSVLYPPFGRPDWDLEDHDNMMFVIMCYCWHYAIDILIVAIIYILVHCFIQRRRASSGLTEIKLDLQKEKAKEDCASLLKAIYEE
ncbi:transmembrane protein 45B-like [Anolis sagrei]|uniref:transmembrane protein 45B-like n=1 Tax=Anolis sagrei TaxID=38937 RepID=UPI003522641F